MSTQIVDSGSSVSGIVVSSGSTLLILSGGSATGTVVSSGGAETVFGIASGTEIEGFGSEAVSAGGIAIGASVGSAGAQFIYSGGIASDTAVGSGGEAYVLAGGLSVSGQVGDGGLLIVSSGGVARADTLQAGGVQQVQGGGIASGTLVAGGYDLVSSGGVASGSIVTASGHETVLSGGLSEAAQVGSGGYLVISAGGVADDATVLAGGFSVVSSGGTAVGTVVSSGGFQTVSAGGIASGTQVEAFGVEAVSAGGVSVATFVGSGGAQFIYDQGVASSTVVGSGGEAYVLSKGLAQDAVLDDGGLLVVSSGGEAAATAVTSGGVLLLVGGGIGTEASIGSGGTEIVLSGAEAVGDTVGSGGFLVLSSGGVASDAAVQAGGFLLISSGATASGATVGSGGMEVISAGGSAIGTVLEDGGAIDLDAVGYVAGGSATLDAATDVLSVVENGVTTELQLQGSYDGSYFSLSEAADGSTIVTAEGTPCYCPGTLILTDRGEVAVEDLRIGDRLVTLSGEARPLRWIGRRAYDGRFAAGKADILPVLVRAGALGGGLPRRDLFVSPLHALYLEGVLVPAVALVDGIGIVQARAIDTVSYLHLELETHDILLAEGAAAESFVDDDSRGMFHNAGEYALLYPEEVRRPARFCAPRVEAGERLDAIRRSLATHAAGLMLQGGAAAKHTHFEGCLDPIEDDRIRGWARDTGSAEPVRLRILDNGRTIALVEAGVLRPDLAAVGKGDGRHGFEFVVPGGIDPSRRHVIQVQRVPDQAELDNSPAFLDTGAATPQPVPLIELVGADPADGRYGHLDTARGGLLSGWAWNSADPFEAVAVQIFSDGRLLCRAVANMHRPDLAAAGIGSGRHGFEIDLSAALSPLSRHVLQARIEGTGRSLTGSPLVIEPAGSFDPELEQAVVRAIEATQVPDEQERVLGFVLAQADRIRQQIADTEAGRSMRVRSRRLRRQLGPAIDAVAQPSRRALVIDERLPLPHRDAGSQAVLSHIRALQALGYAVSFVSTEEFGASGEPLRALRALGVAVHGGPAYGSIEEVLRRQADCFDLVYMHRVSTAAAYMALARRAMPRARLLYSVADLHHLRLARQAEAERRPELLGLSHRVRLEECTAAWQADAVLTHSTVEADLLRRSVPAACVREVPWAYAPHAGTGPAFAARNGVALLGNYGHQPNEDAACWLVETVMPLVWARDPSIPCLIAGSDMTARVHALARDGVELLGHVPELDSLWDRVRLSVAPLRFGAGVKGKVLDSMAAGVPCVMSPLGAEGIGLPPTLMALVGADASALAALICRLHRDPAANAAARDQGLAFITERHSEEAVAVALEAAIEKRTLAHAVAAE